MAQYFKILFAFIVLFLAETSVFAQTPYFLLKNSADSAFQTKKYEKAIILFKKALPLSEKPRIDCYYLACSFSFLAQRDSAAFYMNKAMKLGLKFTALTTIDEDKNLNTIRTYPEWAKWRKRLLENTKKHIKSQEKCLYPRLKKELAKRVITDQMYRKIRFPNDKAKRDSIWALQMKIDKENIAWLKAEMKKHGWLGIKEVSQEGDKAAWLIVQHADLDTAFQMSVLKILTEQVKINNTDKMNFAYLTDRVRVNSGGKQVYGTQFGGTSTDSTGKVINAISLPIENPEKVDSLRQTVGLSPLEVYKAQFIQRQNEKR